MSICIKKVEPNKINENFITQLAHVLTYSEPENFVNSIKWWKDWFSNTIPGNKFTIIAEEDHTIIGVVRFWQTPFCNSKWFIEGLEVIPPKRRNGVGKALVTEGIHILINITNEKLYVHIKNNNTASINLHKSLGFKKISTGSINTFGEFRSHIDEYLLVF